MALPYIVSESPRYWSIIAIFHTASAFNAPLERWRRKSECRNVSCADYMVGYQMVKKQNQRRCKLQRQRNLWIMETAELSIARWHYVAASIGRTMLVLCVHWMKQWVNKSNTLFRRTLLRYVRLLAWAVRLSSVVCDVRAPYSQHWTLRQYFCTT